MSLLIDTHVLVWLLIASPRLSSAVYDTLADPLNTVFVSTASAWEMAIKVGLGRLDLPPDLHRWLPAELTAAGLKTLRIELDHVLGVENLPRHHADPFDRLLIAQAIIDGHTIVSADRVFELYDAPLLQC